MLQRVCVLGVLLYLVALDSVNGEKYHSRHRRSWMMPGTLWCGAGSAAENFTNLGVFHGVDLCCREHDHCYPQIQSFEFQYGIRNYRLHTVSHCDCDQRFQLCLHALNDTISTLVGIMFFNILEMPCFDLRDEEQCVEWHWWGGCKRNGSVPKAELQKPAAFNYSSPEGHHTSSPLSHTVRHPLDSPSLTAISSSASPLNNPKVRRRRLKKLRKSQTKNFARNSQGTIEDSYRAEESRGTRRKSHSKGVTNGQLKDKIPQLQINK